MAVYDFNETPVFYADIKDIDIRPEGPFCMSFGYESGALIRSIEATGLINPPVLLERENSKFIIVTGFRRILAARSLGWKQIACRALSESRVSPLQCLIMNLHDNLATREINNVEKGMVLSRLSSYLSTEEMVSRYLPLLGLSRSRSVLDFFIRLEKCLDTESKEYLVKGLISLDTAKSLIDMDSGTRSMVTDIITNLKLSINYQRQFIELIDDISLKKGVSPYMVLRKKEVLEVVSDARLNRSQKVKALFDILRKERFPTLIQAERAFKDMVSRLALPKGMKIFAPQYFEAPDYSLHVIFRNGRDLKKKIEILSGKKELMDLSYPWEEGASCPDQN